MKPWGPMKPHCLAFLLLLAPLLGWTANPPAYRRRIGSPSSSGTDNVLLSLQMSPLIPHLTKRIIILCLFSVTLPRLYTAYSNFVGKSGAILHWRYHRTGSSCLRFLFCILTTNTILFCIILSSASTPYAMHFLSEQFHLNFYLRIFHLL